MVITIGSTVEKKLDLVLEKLDHIEHLLTIGEELPDEEEIELIKEFSERNKKGEVEVVGLQEIIDDL